MQNIINIKLEYTFEQRCIYTENKTKFKRRCINVFNQIKTEFEEKINKFVFIVFINLNK